MVWYWTLIIRSKRITNNATHCFLYSRLDSRNDWINNKSIPGETVETFIPHRGQTLNIIMRNKERVVTVLFSNEVLSDVSHFNNGSWTFRCALEKNI